MSDNGNLSHKKFLEMGIEPMHMLTVCLFFFFFFICTLYTLFWVMVIVNNGAFASALYEAGHCLYGHHKLG
jgi:hypothetical protein